MGSNLGEINVTLGADSSGLAAALKVTAFDARSRLLSASMIISANAGC